MELVIRNREEAGFAWDMVYGNPTNYAVTIYDRYCNVLGQELHKDKSVAFCLDECPTKVTLGYGLGEMELG
jgi:hypothetical protein